MPTDCFICITCHWMYNKWEANLGLNQILLQIDMLSQDDDGMTEEKDESSNENTSGDVGTDSNDNSDDEMINDEESDENSSNDSKAKSNHKYDNEMIDDEESNGSSPSDSEMDCNDVYDNASVTDKSSFTSKDGLKLPTGISISSKRIQMVPPTVTIKKEDRSNIFIRRNIFIPKGSRCCKIHTSNGYLLREDFFKLTAYKDDYRIFNLNYIVNTMQKLRKMVNTHKKSSQYYTYIQFDPNQILAWYCTCRSGPRVVGCCSHGAAGIWFLGYERHQLETNQQPSSINFANLHYCDSISDYEDSSDEDNDARYSSTR
ncbi:unnamed protein product [Rotaria socialis]